MRLVWPFAIIMGVGCGSAGGICLMVDTEETSAACLDGK